MPRHVSPTRTIDLGINPERVRLVMGSVKPITGHEKDGINTQSMSRIYQRENGTDDDPVARVETSLPSQLSRTALFLFCVLVNPT